MDTLRDRLAELADEAPTGGAPATELWARGMRAFRLRAAALAATVLVVGVVGTGVGVRLTDGDDDRSDLASAKTVGIALPIEYPVGEPLPDLGDTPGPLAAIWLAPRAGGGAPEAVGLVAKTGMFGTLPIVVHYEPDPDQDNEDPNARVALSPDGRRVAYEPPTGGLIAHDLVSGETYPSLFEFGIRGVGRWVDATHLLGYVGGGSDADAWLWEPGKAPTLVSPYDVPYGGTDLSLPIQGGGPRSCSSPTLQNVRIHQETGRDWAGSFEVPALCDVLGVTRSGILLGHWKDRKGGNGTVVALDVRGLETPFEDPALRRIVAIAGAPLRVTFAAHLIGEALDADGGRS